MVTTEIQPPLSRRGLLGLTAVALLAALVIVFGAFLPAEYHLDPLGLGRLTGTERMWAPPEETVAAKPSSDPEPAVRTYATAFRSDEIIVPLQAGGDPSRNDEIEYKVHLKKGGTYVYSWAVIGSSGPTDVYVEYHGHTLASRDTMKVAYYKKGFAQNDNGAFTAPFDGIHGWFFQNQSLKPLRIKLRLAGFYDLVPPGEAGNEGELVAKRLE
ncbi:hypothetical protein [Sphingomonas sp. UYP23]